MQFGYKKPVLPFSKLTVFIFISLFLFPSCLTFYKIPEEYVPDKKVVYLKQKVEFQPIRYEPELTNPYSWKADVQVDPENPSFLKFTDFNYFLKPDYNQDAQVYEELKSHVEYIKTNAEYLKFVDLINQAQFTKPEVRKITEGDKVKDYSNAIEYNYPEVAGATISDFGNGDYKINLPDGNTYHQKKDGRYFEDDKAGKELYAVFAEDNYRFIQNGNKYIKYNSDSCKIETPEGNIKKSNVPFPQYAFEPVGKNYSYIIFFNDTDFKNYHSICIEHKNGLRLDFIYEFKQILITYKTEVLVINEQYEKSHHFLNTKENVYKPDTLYSYYFPEGIRIADIHKPLSYSVVNPAWPENYSMKKIGPFILIYTKKDEPLLNKIDSRKLTDVHNFAVRTSGITYAVDRSIILPPDLSSYRKLHAQHKNELLNWYPSGFEMKDVIVMWPPSVKRYQAPEGEQYFWNTEFYDILIHELTHLMAGEITGVFSPLPVWLNEGLALYVEGEWSSETKRYWEITFNVAYHLNKLLSWEDVSSRNTGEFPIDKARIHYAQSYKMTSYLITKYGKNKVIEYCKSFKRNYENLNNLNIAKEYSEKFKQIFGITWDENLKNFTVFLTEKKEETAKKNK